MFVKGKSLIKSYFSWKELMSKQLETLCIKWKHWEIILYLHREQLRPFIIQHRLYDNKRNDNYFAPPWNIINSCCKTTISKWQQKTTKTEKYLKKKEKHTKQFARKYLHKNSQSNNWLSSFQVKAHFCETVKGTKTYKNARIWKKEQFCNENWLH